MVRYVYMLVLAAAQLWNALPGASKESHFLVLLAYCAISDTFALYRTLYDIAQYAVKQIFTVFWGLHFLEDNTLGPLEKLLVGLQGSTRSRWKGLSKTNIFRWYWCSLLLKVSLYYSMFDIEHSLHIKSVETIQYDKIHIYN